MLNKIVRAGEDEDLSNFFENVMEMCLGISNKQIKDPVRKQRGIQRINSLPFLHGNPVASYGELMVIKN